MVFCSTRACWFCIGIKNYLSTWNIQNQKLTPNLRLKAKRIGLLESTYLIQMELEKHSHCLILNCVKEYLQKTKNFGFSHLNLCFHHLTSYIKRLLIGLIVKVQFPYYFIQYLKINLHLLLDIFHVINKKRIC